MGKIIISENISLDGVIQDPTGEEGLAFGGWFNQIPDADREAWVKAEFQEALDTEAWLIGRRTYTWFAQRWADRPGEWADRLRSIPKYIVSSTLDEAAEWTNSTILTGDVIEEVTRLKRTVEGNILVYASSHLVQTLIEHDLADELRLMTHPFVLGAGQRLFGATSSRKSLSLVDVRTIGTGLVLLTYQTSR